MVIGIKMNTVEIDNVTSINKGEKRKGIPRKETNGTFIKLLSMKTLLNIAFSASCAGKIIKNDNNNETPSIM